MGHMADSTSGRSGLAWVAKLIMANAIVGFAAGLALLTLPGAFMSVLGQSTDAAGIAYARLYGAELLGFSLATWLARDASATAMRPIVYGHIVNESLTAVVVAAAAVAGTGNLLLWPLAALVAGFAVAYLIAAVRSRQA